MSAATFVKILRARSRRIGVKLAVLGAATGTAAALSLGPATPIVRADQPGPAAVDILQDVYTTGPLAGLLAALGVDRIGPISVASVPSVGDVNLTLVLDGPVDKNPQALYDVVNNLGFLKRGLPNLSTGAYTYDRIVCTTGGSCSTPNEFPATLGVGTGAVKLI